MMLGLLAGAAGLALFGDKTPPGKAAEVVASVPRRVAAATVVRPAGERDAFIEALVPRARLVPEAAGSGRRDLFASPPAPPAPKPVAMLPAVTPPPQAPPMPFRVLGKKQEGEAWEVFLGRDDTSFIVRAGSVLEAAYRIDKIDPPTLVMTHIPTGQAQTLAIGDAR